MKSIQAQASLAIKKELKKHFPKVKFSVTSQSFAGGDAVDIRWENGATTKQIAEITNKYQYGHFDGMTDSYNITNNRDDIPQVKYVMKHRHVTKEIYDQAFIYIQESWKCFKDKKINECSHEIKQQTGCWDGCEFLGRFLRQIDLSNGLDVQVLDEIIYGI